MTATLTASGSTSHTLPTLRALALADARRFARHPLFLLGATLLLILAVVSAIQAKGDPSPLFGTLMIAFFLGVFGFAVAHRLTTALRRSSDLADTAPVGERPRTAALCLACLVPASVATVMTVFMIVSGQLWPPVGDPANAPVAWFSHEPDLAIWATLIALGPVAALGGSLLGVAVARWAPFRGSALLGVVVLVVGCAMPSEASTPWRALPPWTTLWDEHVDEHGKLASSNLITGVVPQWYLGYVLCLCGLAVVAALLHAPGNRRPLLWSGAALALGAAGFFLLSVA
jgi:hypothetical protein